MFSALRKGSPVYILFKDEIPTFVKGTVESATYPTYNTNYYNGQTMDININTEDDKMEFKNIMPSLSVVDYKNAILSETKELLIPEVETLLQNSKSIVENVDFHKKVIDSCEKMLKDLSPKYAKEIQHDEDINNLKSEIGGIKSKMDTIIQMLSRSDVQN